jgi:hypothetical protein
MCGVWAPCAEYDLAASLQSIDACEKAVPPARLLHSVSLFGKNSLQDPAAYWRQDTPGENWAEIWPTWFRC